jgi:hypothetical protein
MSMGGRKKHQMNFDLIIIMAHYVNGGKRKTPNEF